jgi:hypothetical protein
MRALLAAAIGYLPAPSSSSYLRDYSRGKDGNSASRILAQGNGGLPCSSLEASGAGISCDLEKSDFDYASVHMRNEPLMTREQGYDREVKFKADRTLFVMSLCSCD